MASAVALSAQTAPLTVDVTSREAVRQFYRAIYWRSEGVPIGFTGDVLAGVAGDTASDWKESVRLRVNYFRAMAGVPAGITFDPVYSGKAQQDALMSAVNNQLTHTPPASFTFYTAAGAEAAAHGNLGLIEYGPDAVNGYMNDGDGDNAAVGHRRWVLYPQTKSMGTGDMPATVQTNPSNTLWVVDGNVGGPRPAGRNAYVSWPVAGYNPYPVVFSRWSFSYPGADFSSCFVTVTRGTAAVPVSVQSVGGNYGENSVVWTLNHEDPALIKSYPRPSADTTYTVKITNVSLNGSALNFRYDVVIFDPDQAAPGDLPVAVTGPTNPVMGQAATYSVSLPSLYGGLQWRALALNPASPTFRAASGLQGLVPKTSTYNPIVTDVSFNGTASYHLRHVVPLVNPQTLTLPDTYYVPTPAASLTFQSRLGYATFDQSAHVQVSLDDGVSWSDLYAQSGDGGPGEAIFTLRTVSLAAYQGRVVRLRFHYTFAPPGSVFQQDLPGVGWYFDQVALTGVNLVGAGGASGVLSGGAFASTPTDATQAGLQARGVLPAGYPGEWGPVLLTSIAPGLVPPSSPNAILRNLSLSKAIGPNSPTISVGFNLVGSAARPLLVRADGPSLAAFGVTGFLAAPALKIATAAGAPVAQNSNWGGDPVISAAAARVGAFALGPTSADAAVYASFPPGGYTALISGQGGAAGTVLAELYDAGTDSAARLNNLSAITFAGAGADILTVGFVVGGSGNETVMLRAVGPGLSQFGVPGLMADPALTLYVGGSATPAASNNDWGKSAVAAQIGTTFSQVGAFALDAASQDAVLLVNLPPGSYTAQVTGSGGSTGTVLLEIYEVR